MSEAAFLVCTRCKESKAEDQFGSESRKTNGKNSWCKPCSNTASRSSRAKKPHLTETYNRRAFRTERFGLPWREMKALYDVQYTKQDGKCAICGTTEYGKNRNRFAFDHDHQTGELRGLLCNSCNYALGQFKDDRSRLESAVRYLREYGR